MRLALILGAVVSTTLAWPHRHHHGGHQCSSIPSPKETGELTILLENDLDAFTPKLSSLLMSKPQTFNAAEASCKCLGETLASFSGNQTLEVVAQLEENKVAGLLWVASTSGAKKSHSKCFAIHASNGAISQQPCDKKLPALCTNSAKAFNAISQDNSKTIEVETPLGPVVGFRDNQVFRFQGIPFSEPPVRFSRAQPKKPWKKALNATVFGARCPQFSEYSDIVTSSSPLLDNISDDCLFANIFTPVLPSSPAKLKPVMVWIYGGGFTTGYSDSPFYQGNNLASRGDVVFVSFNYRLNIFGLFLDEANGAPGNLVVSDQILALQWVRKNIAYFGGDPEKITIFGESAGASSVRTLLISPYARGLFRAAITESDPIGLGYWSKNTTLDISAAFLSNLSCPDIHCARNASIAAVALAGQRALAIDELHDLQANKGEPWNLYRDGNLIPMNILDAANSGKFNKVPILWSTNQDEGGGFISAAVGGPKALSDGQTPPNSTNYFAAIGSGNFYKPGQLSSILSSGLYPYHIKDTTPPNPLAVMDALTRLVTDFSWLCPTEEIVSALSQHVPIYKGLFLQRPSGLYASTNYCYGKVCHSDEILLVMGALPYYQVAGFNVTAQDLIFSREIVDRWASFAKTLSPNTKDYTSWPKVGSQGETLQLQNVVAETVGTNLRSAQCTFLQNVVHFDFATYPA